MPRSAWFGAEEFCEAGFQSEIEVGRSGPGSYDKTTQNLPFRVLEIDIAATAHRHNFQVFCVDELLLCDVYF